VQDTGVIQGISQASQSISYPAMAEKQKELAQIILRDPSVESLSSFIGADGINTTLNSGRVSINLKPLDQRHMSASDVIRRLQNNLQQVHGMHLYMQPVQDITVDDRVSRTQYQYTLEDPDTDELNEWTDKFVAQLEKIPELEDVATDQQTGARAIQLEIDRVTASRLGIAPTTIDNTLYDAYGQRQINTLYTQLNQYHVILETSPEWQQNPANLHPVQRFFGSQRSRRVLILFLLSLRVGRLQCPHQFGALHAVFRGCHRAGYGAGRNHQFFRKLSERRHRFGDHAQYLHRLGWLQRHPPGRIYSRFANY
jgi:multidrug efflux pump subunit AcrB